MKKIKKNFEQGFTLVEIMLGIILTSLLILIIYSVMINSINFTRKSQHKSSMQLSVNNAFRVIADEIRSANDIELINNYSQEDAEDDNWFYLVLNSDGELILIDDNGNERVLTHNIVIHTDIQLLENDGKNFLEFELRAQKEDSNYTATRTILLNNISNEPSVSNEFGLRFKR